LERLDVVNYNLKGATKKSAGGVRSQPICWIDWLDFLSLNPILISEIGKIMLNTFQIIPTYIKDIMGNCFNAKIVFKRSYQNQIYIFIS
jgi:hypothetical protein